MKKLYGEDVTIHKTLAKVELAIRRASSSPTVNISDPYELLTQMARELARIQKEMTDEC